MSSSTVTYTSIPSDSDLPQWGFHLMDPDEFEAPQSLEQAPPSPDYMPGPEYPEYVASSDDEIPVEDQPLHVDALPTALSLGYVDDSDPLEEDPDEDQKEDPKEYLATEETESFEIDESATTPQPPQTMVQVSMTHFHRAHIYVRPHTPPSASTEALIAETDIPEVEMPPRKKACFTAPTYRFIDTLDASIRASEGRVMIAVGEVNERVTNLATTQRQDAHELYAWSCSEDKSTILEALIGTQEARTTSLEAQVGTLWTQHDRLEWQR
ncbi:hypothetical protein Tco_1078790 [Tanacetum coccineum]|uniref:Uncharacterized protein n=1 Tax=Tanacetum coccineum TaxID=301880 RepID=A0ABQ5HQI2_9ASTR